MNPLTDFLQHPVTAQLGWTLLHFVWQGALLAAGFALARSAWRGRSANARYLAGCVTLFLMVGAAMGTFMLLEDAPSKPPAAFAAPSSTAMPPAASPTSIWSEPRTASGPWFDGFGSDLETALRWGVVVWAFGVAALTLRLLGGWLRVRQAQKRSGDTLEDRLGSRLRELQQRLGVSRPVRLAKSALVEVPTVIGWFRPVILLPASTLTGLSPVQLDLILAHELAHLRRWDHWVNLVQIVIETLLFYHPAVGWVSRCVREEREHCCDEQAVAACGNPLAYAQALATLEELRHSPSNFALAASGAPLLARIRRILSLPDDERGGGSWRSAGSALLVLGLLMMATGLGLYLFAGRYFVATNTIRIERVGTPETPLPATPGPVTFDPDMIVTEIRIRHLGVLHAVVQQLGLANRWSGDDGTTPLTDAEAVTRLSNQLELRRKFRSSPLIDISARSADAEEAATIANAVAEAYRESRFNESMKPSRRGLLVLKENLQQQSDQVSRLQTDVDELRTRVNIDPTFSDEASLRAMLEADRIAPLSKLLADSRAESMVVKERLDALRRLDSDTLRQSVTTLVPSEQLLPQLQAELARVEQDLASKTVEYTQEHPEVRQLIAVQQRIQEQIEARIRGVLIGLDSQANAYQDRVKKLTGQLDEARRDVSATMNAAGEYFQKKRDLESQQRMRDAIVLRVLQEEVDAALPKSSGVEIVNAAERPLHPISRGHPLDQLLIAAGFFTSLIGLVVRRVGTPAGA